MIKEPIVIPYGLNIDVAKAGMDYVRKKLLAFLPKETTLGKYRILEEKMEKALIGHGVRLMKDLKQAGWMKEAVEPNG